MKYLFTLVLIALFSTQCFAQINPDRIVESFFKEYEKEGSTKALNTLYESNKWIDPNGSALISLKEQMETLTEDFIGKFRGYELIVEKKLADSYILRSYLVKYDRQPIRFTFQFYRPDKEWMLFSFKYDGNIDDEIEEAAKLYYFRLN